MSELARTVRTGSRMGLRAEAMLSAALLSELVFPGDSLWVVSSWITDVEVLDNSHGGFDSVLGDDPPAVCFLSQMLALIASAGGRLRVVTRPDTHNEIFIRRLRAAVTEAGRLRVVPDPTVHEKTICGRDWLFSGSMNFTLNGLGSNEESVTYRVGGPQASQAKLDFAERWKDLP